MMIFKSCNMDIDLLLNTSINNIHSVYGGVRGTTLSSKHNMQYWKTVIESGVRTIIELRNNDHSDRLCQMCEKHGIRYFSFPMDSHSIPDEVIAAKLKEFFNIIDNGDFYIACAMGLHRTDIALSIYWVFHGAENNISPPCLIGHFPPINEQYRPNVDSSRILRRLNSLYDYLSLNNTIDIPDKITFTLRKKRLIYHQSPIL